MYTHTTYCTLVQHERIISSMFTDHRCHLVVNCSISVAQKKPKTKWASLFHWTLFFLFPLFWQECWLKQPLQSVQMQYDSRHLRNALLAFTPRHIQKVLGWFWTQRIHTVMLLYSHFRWTTDKQCACLCVSVCVCVCVCVCDSVHEDDCWDHCIFVQLLPSGYNVDKHDACHI